MEQEMWNKAQKIKQAGVGIGQGRLHQEEMAGCDLSFWKSFCLPVENHLGLVQGRAGAGGTVRGISWKLHYPGKRNTVPNQSKGGFLYVFVYFWDTTNRMFKCVHFWVFIVFLTIYHLFFVWVFWLWGVWDLSYPTRAKHEPAALGGSLNHWTTREIPECVHFQVPI